MTIKDFIKTSALLRPVYALCRDVKMLGMMTESDDHYICRKFDRILHFRPNLNNPVTFQEKLQWIKLNDRKPIYHTMVDKVEVKKFIVDRVGGGILFQQSVCMRSFMILILTSCQMSSF